MATQANQLSGGGTGPSGFQPYPLNQGDDSTDVFRSLTNILGTGGVGAQELGFGAVQKPLDYWSKILSGNKAEISGALEPELTATKEQFGAQRRVLDQYTPMGGGRSQAISNLGTKQAQTTAGIISTARQDAATKLAETGTAEQQIGVQQLGQAINAILQKMGLAIQGGTANTFSTILQGIGAII